MGCEQGGWDGALGTRKDGKEKVVEEIKMLLRSRAAELKIQPLRMQCPALPDSGRTALKWKVQG